MSRPCSATEALRSNPLGVAGVVGQTHGDASLVWKHRNKQIVDLDDKIDHFGITPRMVIEGLVGAANDLGLPATQELRLNSGSAAMWSE